MSTKRDNTAERIIAAVKESKGLLTLAAKRAGVSYWTIWKYSKDYPTVAKAVEESKEGLLDLAEAKLYQEINNSNMTAIIFFLKTKGKSRGYIERQEVTGKDGEQIEAKPVFIVADKEVQKTQELLLKPGVN
jgi:hypothetical protein